MFHNHPEHENKINTRKLVGQKALLWTFLKTPFIIQPYMYSEHVGQAERK